MAVRVMERCACLAFSRCRPHPIRCHGDTVLAGIGAFERAIVLRCWRLKVLACYGDTF